MLPGGFSPPKHNAEVAVPAPDVKSLAVFKALPVAQAPPCALNLILPVVVLYQISPSDGDGGSLETAGIPPVTEP